MTVDIVDIFAGPGGLGEGFSSLRADDGQRVFNIVNSVEKEATECRTLRLRSLYRRLMDINDLDGYFSYLKNPTQGSFDKLIEQNSEIWELAKNEVLNQEITELSQGELLRTIKNNRHSDKKLVLLGGPPCQAYSLIGRARNRLEISGNTQKWQDDPRRTLYKRYLDFVRELKPDVFVMENVKGILSAKIGKDKVFDLVRTDLANISPGYKLFSLVTNKEPEDLSAKDYIVKSELFGIPQKRHRMIILGVSTRIKKRPSVLTESQELSVHDCISDLPRLRSSFSLREKELSKTSEAWIIEVKKAIESSRFNTPLDEALFPPNTGSEWEECLGNTGALQHWYRPEKMTGVPNHQSRSHILGDIQRYVFCSLFAQENFCSPNMKEFPKHLLPKHENLASLRTDTNLDKESEIVFIDRFKVQIKDEPSLTIASHISKDGHYYIHYDPYQARSLTVREAARLQTFPDDYRFEGNRTSQYHQVGNAVPPYLAFQIAKIISDLLV